MNCLGCNKNFLLNPGDLIYNVSVCEVSCQKNDYCISCEYNSLRDNINCLKCNDTFILDKLGNCISDYHMANVTYDEEGNVVNNP